MNKTELLSLLRTELLRRGVSEEKSVYYVSKLEKNLTDMDDATIGKLFADRTALNELADEICSAEKLGQSGTVARPEESTQISPLSGRSAVNESEKTQAVPIKAAAGGNAHTRAVTVGAPARSAVKISHGRQIPEKLTRKLNKWITPEAVLPLIIYAGSWLIAGLAFLTVLFLSAATVILALVGIIFGILQLFSGNPAAGVYEIGIGTSLLGVAMLFVLLLRQIVKRFAPYLLKRVKVFCQNMYRKSIEDLRKKTEGAR